ncbi:MAG: hypothetical protein GF364_12475 [Candidatus Lokiarchaeota archaeon]|nr:hypothetical protein [Candidatus Lokiarchaeota archaeon]
MKKFDYHTHNGYSRCVKAPWKIIAGWKVAKSKGIEKLGVTNHVHFNHPEQHYLTHLRKEIQEINEDGLLLGVELDIDSPDGQNVLKKETYAIIDYVIAAPHNQPTDFLNNFDFDKEDEEAYFSDLKKILTMAMKQIQFDIWAHPFLQELNKLDLRYWDIYLEDIFMDCLEICVNRGIAIEITAQWHKEYSRPKKNTWYPEMTISKELYEIINKMYKIAADNKDIKFSLASDSHSLQHIGDISVPLFYVEKLHISDDRILEIEKKS